MMLHALFAAAALSAQDTLSPPARRILDDIRYLAADAREGRGIGTQGLADAARYLADAFRRAGLKPAFAGGSYIQPFTISADAPAAMHSNVAGQATENVVAVLPGTSPRLRGQVVVVGAHYDHLGLGGFGALDPDSNGVVHNGADDNASGAAALLEIARRLSALRPARTIVFVAFSGEELGLLGSSYYVSHPALQPVDSIYAMLNLDMVGRLRNGKLMALGALTAQEFGPLLDSLNRVEPPVSAGPAGRTAYRFDLRASGDGWGPSDHASFYAVKRPVLQFFTDLHADYHRSTDDWDKINASGTARVAEFVADLAWSLANRPGPLTFVDVPRPQVAAGGSGYGPYLGTIPDMTESPGGVRLNGVRTGSPAEKAGLARGDIITGLGRHAVANLMDMTIALREHQAGDTVTITVKRGEETLRMQAVLAKRGS